MTLINPELINSIFMDCLFREEEVTGLTSDGVPKNAVKVKGITSTFCFHDERLESHRAEIKDAASHLPKTFYPVSEGGGGGWSFLNLCNDENDEQWTGLHQRMEQLSCLAVGLNMAQFMTLTPMYLMPGGMPYIIFFPNGLEVKTK